MDIGWLGCIIQIKKCTILVSNVDNEGSCACMKVGGIWEFSVLSSQFCSKHKTALKKIVFLKKVNVTLIQIMWNECDNTLLSCMI